MKDIADEIARIHGYDRYQRALTSMVYNFFDKKKTGSRAIATSKAEVSINEQLAEELRKSVTKKIKRRELYAIFKDNTWTADLAEIE